MRGHEEIIRLRLRRMAPKTVHVWCGTDALNGCSNWHENTAHAEVEIRDDEPLSGLDLRFTVGMLVFVNGADPFRVAAVHAGCLAAGATRVLSCAVGLDGEPGRLMDSAAEEACTS